MLPCKDCNCKDCEKEHLDQPLLAKSVSMAGAKRARKIPTKRTMAPERKEVSHDLRDSIGLRIAFTCFRTRPPDEWTPNFQGTYSKSISFVNTAEQIHLLDQGTDTLRSQSYHAKIATANIAKEHLDFGPTFAGEVSAWQERRGPGRCQRKQDQKCQDDVW
jgi:hypothetical protein